MITIEQCQVFSGLLSSEMVMGTVPSPRHRARLSGYLLNLKWGSATVRELIVADIRAALDLGASVRAADLVVVLRLFLSDHPEARRSGNRKTGALHPECARKPVHMTAPPATGRDHANHCEAVLPAHVGTYEAVAISE